MTTSVLKLALGILGGALLICLAGIIWLASANPARAIPDVLVGTTSLVGGAIVGILVPSKQPGEDGAAGDAVIWIAVAALVLAALALFGVRLG
jgi:hypothetical protein